MNVKCKNLSHFDCRICHRVAINKICSIVVTQTLTRTLSNFHFCPLILGPLAKNSSFPSACFIKMLQILRKLEQVGLQIEIISCQKSTKSIFHGWKFYQQAEDIDKCMNESDKNPTKKIKEAKASSFFTINAALQCCFLEIDIFLYI